MGVRPSTLAAIMAQSSPAAGLASGAVGEWYADEYVATPRKCVPNRASAQAVSQNLLMAPSRLFSNSQFWTKSSVTAVDNTVSGVDGSTQASTLAVSAGGTLRIAQSVTMPAGTYTVVVAVKRNTGTDQTFCLSTNGGTTRSTVYTATSSWQRFAYTQTIGSTFASNQFMLLSSDGATAADLQIDSFEVFSGSSDLGRVPLSGHLILGRAQADTAASASGGELIFESTNAAALVQFGAALSTSSGFTVQAAVRKTTTAAAYSSVLSDILDFDKLTCATAINGRPWFKLGGATRSFGSVGVSNYWNLLGLGYHVITWRATATVAEMWVDDVRLFSEANTLGAMACKDLFVGIALSFGASSGLRINSMAVYERALTETEVRSNVNVLTTRLAASGFSVAPCDFVVFEGDSITAASSFSFPYQVTFSRAKPVLGVNLGVGGATTATMAARVARVNDVVPPTKAGRKFILHAFTGANDLASLGASAWLSAMDGYLNTSVTAAYDARIVTTILPRATAGHNTARATVNPTLRTWPGLGKCTAVSDFAANADIGDDDDYTNLTFYSDGIHPTAAGALIEAGIAKTQIDAA